MLEALGELSFEGQVSLVGLLLFGVAGLILLFGGLASFRRFVYVVATRTADANAVDSGVVEVDGVVVPGDDDLDAPISDVRSVAYEFEVQRYEPDTNGGHWRTRQQGHDHVPFLLQDASGRVGVDPTKSALRYTDSHIVSLGSDETVPEYVRDDIKSPTDFEDGLLEGKLAAKTGRIRYVERRLSVGGHVYARGLADPERSVAGTRPTIIEPGEHGLLSRLRTGPFTVTDAHEGATGDTFLFRSLLHVLVGGLLLAFVTAVLYVAL